MTKKDFQLLVFVDDDKMTNIFHEIVVKDSEVTEKALFFSSPVDALDHFRALSQSGSPAYPDALFLDINMPQLTGWEFLEEYKKLDTERCPVIIMLTTSLLPGDKKRAKDEALVYKMISKPLNKDFLRDLSKELKNQRLT